MKANCLLSVLFLFVWIFSANATILRVNNTPADGNIPGSNAPYSNFAAAQTAAVDGDTILLEPTPDSYGSMTVTKRLVILGNGCFLDQHVPPLVANTNPTFFHYLNFVDGSSGSVVMGLTCDVSNGGITVYVDSILIARCAPRLVHLADDVSFIRIFQNYLEYGLYSTNDVKKADHIYIFNNLIRIHFSFQPDDHDIYIINNVVGWGVHHPVQRPEVYNAIVRNNIFHTLQGNWDFLYEGCLIENNIAEWTGFFDPPDLPQNIESVDMNDVFVNTGASDEQWQLLTGGGNPNPALGYGYYNGEDCGAFDVPDVPMFDTYAPFRIGCLPPIPIIYEYSIIQNGGNLDVEMSVKSNN